MEQAIAVQPGRDEAGAAITCRACVPDSQARVCLPSRRERQRGTAARQLGPFCTPIKLDNRNPILETVIPVTQQRGQREGARTGGRAPAPDGRSLLEPGYLSDYLSAGTRTISTEQGALRATNSALLPSSKRGIPLWP